MDPVEAGAGSAMSLGSAAVSPCLGGGEAGHLPLPQHPPEEDLIGVF